MAPRPASRIHHSIVAAHWAAISSTTSSESGRSPIKSHRGHGAAVAQRGPICVVSPSFVRRPIASICEAAPSPFAQARRARAPGFPSGSGVGRPVVRAPRPPGRGHLPHCEAGCFPSGAHPRGTRARWQPRVSSRAPCARSPASVFSVPARCGASPAPPGAAAGSAALGARGDRRPVASIPSSYQNATYSIASPGLASITYPRRSRVTRL
jgi:hypothetical protein